MILTYGQIEATIVGHLRIHPDRVGTLRARIKQLQKLQFPIGVNVGRGTKMQYSGEHLFQLVTAFELINLGLPAFTATTIATENWDVFAAAYAYAIKLRNSSLSTSKMPFIYTRITHVALGALLSEQDADDSGDRHRNHGHVEAIARLLRSPPTAGHILLCTSQIAESTLGAARRVGRVPNAFKDDEFEGWPTHHSTDRLKLLPDSANVSDD